jgi:hypothetical protein
MLTAPMNAADDPTAFAVLCAKRRKIGAWWLGRAVAAVVGMALLLLM